jgi:Ca2+-binding EF-hand superfamily protein
MNWLKTSIAVVLLAAASCASAAPTADKKEQKAMEYAKEMLKLMDTDANGKVSREEFMTYMSKQFDILDVNKDGELDVKELTGMRYTPRTGGTTR